jgi:hypothetical protein
MNPLFFFAGVGAFIVTAVLLSWLYEKKRTHAMKALAGSLKFTFSARDNAILQRMRPFHLFSQGHSQKATNIMEGCANDIDVVIMDYQYTTGSGKSSHMWMQTVIVFRSPLLRLPAFALRPETLFHKLGEVFGYQDIDFPAHPSFSKRYLLQGSDEDAVRALFSDALLSHYGQSKGLSTEGDGSRFIFFRTSKRVPPKGITAFLKEGFALFALLKTSA